MLNQKPSYAAVPLVEIWRGDIIESWQRGHIVVLDGTGQTVAMLGAPETLTYLRSASKPQQALPVITSGAAARFGFTPAELAIMCGSHNGDAYQVAMVQSILQKIGLRETALQCGAHEPYGKQTAADLRQSNTQPRAVHNNCSGKHTGMLALAQHLGADTTNYLEREHPVQVAAAQAVAQFAGVARENLAYGVDGCGVPTFGVTVQQMALMYARLMLPPMDWDTQTRQACETLCAAMRAHPEMVGGWTDSLDTALMRVLQIRIIAKAGAEGVFTAAVQPSLRWPQGLAVALKIEDGDPAHRARRLAVLELLKQLEVLKVGELAQLAEFGEMAIYNRRGTQVGVTRANFRIN